MKPYKDPDACFHQYNCAMDEIKDFNIIQSNTNNPILNLRKALPEQAPDIKFFESSAKPLIIFSQTLLFPVILLANSLSQFLVNLLRQIFQNRSEMEIINSRYLFLTHLTESPITGELEDTYLSIMSRSEALRESSTKIFLPHGILNIDGKKSPNHDVVLMRSIHLIKMFRIQSINSAIALKMLTIALVARDLSLNARLLLTMAAKRQAHRSCIYDLVVAEHCIRLVKNTCAKVFISTYEGHPFEITTIKKLRETYPDLIILAYQHAPIVNSQKGFFRGLDYFLGETYLLTTGEIPKQIVISKVAAMKGKTFVLGSKKNLGRKVCVSDEKFRKLSRILLAPEASVDAIYELLRNSQDLLQENRGTIFMRLHPRIKSKDLIQELEEKFKRIQFSFEESLFVDLLSAEKCVYRSSAVGLQAMQLGVIPLYRSDFSQKMLDPLYLVSQVHGYGNISQIIFNFQNGDLPDLQIRNAILKIVEIGNAYFEKTNAKTLNWISQF